MIGSSINCKIYMWPIYKKGHWKVGVLYSLLPESGLI